MHLMLHFQNVHLIYISACYSSVLCYFKSEVIDDVSYVMSGDCPRFSRVSFAVGDKVLPTKQNIYDIDAYNSAICSLHITVYACTTRQ